MRKSYPPCSSRREERAERRTAHIAALRKRAAETDAKLKRLYDAIENGVADLTDPLLKDRIVELKATRDQARADAERAEGALERLGPAISRRALSTRLPGPPAGACAPSLAATAATTSVHLPSGSKWTRKKVRIMGSKSVLLRTLVAASSSKKAGFGVPSFVPNWRARRDSNS